MKRDNLFIIHYKKLSVKSVPDMIDFKKVV